MRGAADNEPVQRYLRSLGYQLDAQGAANLWATQGKDLLAALNSKNATTGLGVNAIRKSKGF